MTVSRGADGKVRRTKDRNYYYVCDVAPTIVGGRVGGKLSQPLMTKFLNKSQRSGMNDSDTILGEAGRADREFSLTMCTVGQDQTSEDKGVIDEKASARDEM